MVRYMSCNHAKLLKKTLAKNAKNIYKYSINFCKRLFLEEILVLGDSHAEVFYQQNFKLTFPNLFFNVVIVGGATVSGLENPNSKTQSLPIFLTNLKHSKPKTVITLLGEVDTGFVIWYRAEKYKNSISSMLNKAIHNYQNFLREISISKNCPIICISTTLPTIDDGYNWEGYVANARREVKATQLQRTKLTNEFNKCMRDFCEKNNIFYLSFDDETLGDNGLLKSEILNINGNDHHYDFEKYSHLIINKLKAILS